MMAAPPLVLAGRTDVAVAAGPSATGTHVLGRAAVAFPALRAFFARLTHPAVALPLLSRPPGCGTRRAAYELALRSSGWHYLQHACFLAAGLLFWYPVVRPYPSHPRWSLWLLLPYLILADVQNTVLSALLTFSDHVLYPYYLQIPRLGRLSALGGSIGGRCPHVGTRFPGFSLAPVLDRLPASVRWRAKRDACGRRGSTRGRSGSEADERAKIKGRGCVSLPLFPHCPPLSPCSVRLVSTCCASRWWVGS